MPNRLAAESSPYLRQHAENPVDWYPWGEEALARARAEDRPILLSIGYAACHWCHVMAHESFESEATAAVMNELFVNVKVDREERPDIDAIYMQAVQAMTGHGGWPMTVFLTPAGEPFYAGTYFPPEDRHGMPSFERVLRSVATAYHTQRSRVEQTAAAVREMYDRQSAPSRASRQVTAQTLERAYRQIAAQYDTEHGGFGGAPKFPQVMALDYALRHWRRTGANGALELARHSFRAMARGGVYDQVGGGFHRYSVDARWLVPHFEKMLYDNALLARLGVHLWQATGELEARRIAEETLEWVAREMTAPGGGFYSTLDADSEGEEGRFYLWDAAELDALLGSDAPIARAYWGVTPGGNFEGRNILYVPNAPHAVAEQLGIGVERLAEAVGRSRPLLYAARAKRVWPSRDEKILTGWNGLMIRAAAEAARAFGSADHATMARGAGAFLRDAMVREDGRVWRVYAEGAARIGGVLEDHASAALAFLALHELTFDRAWLELARRVADATVAAFWDDEAGHFYDTARDGERLVTRPREVTDNAVPSGTSLAVELLLQLGDLLHDAEMTRRASWVLETLAEPLARHGIAFGHLLGAADAAVRGAVEVAIVGDPAADDFRALAATVGAHYLPGLVLTGGAPASDDDVVALLAGRPMVDGRATAYVCRNYACSTPTTEPAVLAEQLAAAPRVAPSSAAP